LKPRRIESERTGLLLCNCFERPFNRKTLNEITGWLQEHDPEAVIQAGKKLCKGGKGLRSFVEREGLMQIVVGACRKRKAFLEEVVEGQGFKPFSIVTIPVLESCLLAHPVDESVEKTKVLLHSALKGLSARSGKMKDNTYLTFLPRKRRFSRRAFFKIPTKLHPRLVPFVNHDRCAAPRGCDICIDACPVDALTKDDRKIKFTPVRCNGCGECHSACPCGAISYPPCSLEAFEAEIGALAGSNSENLRPRVVLFACSRRAQLIDSAEADGLYYPGNVVIAEVPCLGNLTSLKLLRTLELGANGVATLPCNEGCKVGIQPKTIREKIDNASSILDAIGMESQRITSLDDCDDLQTSIEGIRSFSSRISNIGELFPSRVSIPPLELDDNLLKLTRRLAKEHRVDDEECLKDPSLPFWSLEIESGKCHLCTLCSTSCPTKAITLRQDDDCIELLFSYKRCAACGLCLKLCPTEAFKVENVLNLRETGKPYRVLKEERLARCEKCGAHISPIGAHALGSMAGLSEEYLRLISRHCPRCRLEATQVLEDSLHSEAE
jgi:ferredoxin